MQQSFQMEESPDKTLSDSYLEKINFLFVSLLDQFIRALNLLILIDCDEQNMKIDCNVFAMNGLWTFSFSQWIEVPNNFQDFETTWRMIQWIVYFFLYKVLTRMHHFSDFLFKMHPFVPEIAVSVASCQMAANSQKNITSRTLVWKASNSYKS